MNKNIITIESSLCRNVISIVCNKKEKECIILRVAKALAAEKNADNSLKLAVRE